MVSRIIFEDRAQGARALQFWVMADSSLCRYLDQGNGGWLNIFAGFFCGITAGLLWSTQGYITTTYATEQEKGKYIATTWLFNASGSVIGASEFPRCPPQR